MVSEPAIEHAQTEFETTFEAQYARITRIIGRIVHHPARAEELAFDILCKLWRNSANAGDNVDAWLSRAAVRAGLDELRRNTRRLKYERFVGWLREPQTPEALHVASEEQSRPNGWTPNSR